MRLCYSAPWTVQMTETIGAREAQSLRTRQAILTSGANLLAERPIDAISISDIVEAANVAKGSFYNHFPDKETMATAIAMSIRAELQTRVESANTNVTDPAYRVVRGMCTFIHFALTNPSHARIMLRGHEWATSGNDYVNQGIHANIAAGIAAGNFLKRAEDAGVVQMIGATWVTMMRVIEEKLDLEATQKLATAVVSLILCGFGVEERAALRIAGDSARDIIKSAATEADSKALTGVAS